MEDERVKVKDTNKEGIIEGYIGNDEYVIKFPNGVLQMYSENELEFENCQPYKDDRQIIKNFIMYINNNVKHYETMDIDNQNFIADMCAISGLREEEYLDIFKNELEVAQEEEMEM